MKKKQIYLLISVTLTLIGYLLGYLRKSSTPNSLNPQASPTPQVSQALSAVTSVDNTNTGEIGYKVTKVIDGDTIQIEGGYKIRYIGIDAPETVDPKRPVGCYGRQASDKNKELVLGKNIIPEKDVSETDKFGRLLRYVYLAGPEASSGSVFVNDYLVRSGYAKVSTYPPDVKYQQQFLESERYARENNLGLWGKCL